MIIGVTLLSLKYFSFLIFYTSQQKKKKINAINGLRVRIFWSSSFLVNLRYVIHPKIEIENLIYFLTFVIYLFRKPCWKKDVINIILRKTNQFNPMQILINKQSTIKEFQHKQKKTRRVIRVSDLYLYYMWG